MHTGIGKISVLIPAHNEEAHIASNVEETVRAFEAFGHEYEIVIIDDGSSDGTYEKMLELSNRFPSVVAKKNMTNFGKGRTIKKGFRYTSGDLIVFLDADLDLHPRQLSGFFDILRAEKADVVIGSKRHPESKGNYPAHRKFVSNIYYFFVKIAFGLPVRDTQTGLKLFKRAVLRKVLPKILVKQYAFDLEILALAHHFGYKIAEAPVVLEYQRGWGRIGVKCLYEAFIDTVAIFYRMHLMRYYDRATTNE